MYFAAAFLFLSETRSIERIERNRQAILSAFNPASVLRRHARHARATAVALFGNSDRASSFHAPCSPRVFLPLFLPGPCPLKPSDSPQMWHQCPPFLRSRLACALRTESASFSFSPHVGSRHAAGSVLAAIGLSGLCLWEGLRRCEAQKRRSLAFQ